MIRRMILLALCGGLLVAGMTASAMAASFVTDSPVLPTPGAVYTTGGPNKAIVVYEWDFDMKLSGGTGGTWPPPDNGAPAISSFFDIFTEITLDDGSGSPQSYHGTASGEMEIEALSLNGLPPGEPYVWRGDLTLFTATLVGDPGTTPILLRESPTLASTGGGTISPPPPPPPPPPTPPAVPTYYRVNSFFDIFTELSLDGGQTWIPASGPLHLESVPEPSTFVVGITGLASLALVALRKKVRRA